MKHTQAVLIKLSVLVIVVALTGVSEMVAAARSAREVPTLSRITR